MCAMCAATVFWLMNSCAAISRLVRPSAKQLQDLGLARGEPDAVVRRRGDRHDAQLPEAGTTRERLRRPDQGASTELLRCSVGRAERAQRRAPIAAGEQGRFGLVQPGVGGWVRL